jgi:hypothetical protein
MFELPSVMGWEYAKKLKNKSGRKLKTVFIESD